VLVESTYGSTLSLAPIHGMITFQTSAANTVVTIRNYLSIGAISLPVSIGGSASGPNASIQIRRES
jgi:hypothetical protein